MFGMVVSPGISMLSMMKIGGWNRRNMIILAMSMSIGLGLFIICSKVNATSAKKSKKLEMLMVSGLLPAAAIASYF